MAVRSNLFFWPQSAYKLYFFNYILDTFRSTLTSKMITRLPKIDTILNLSEGFIPSNLMKIRQPVQEIATGKMRFIHGLEKSIQ